MHILNVRPRSRPWLPGLMLGVAWLADGVSPAERRHGVVSPGMESKESQLPSFYHSSDEVRTLVEGLLSSCEGLHLIRAVFQKSSLPRDDSVRELMGVESQTYRMKPNESVVDVVTLRRSKHKPVLRLAFFFGEHGRELVSTELGVYLLKAFCGHPDVTAEHRQRAGRILDYTEVMLLPNIDESSRKKVEAGPFCYRHSGVDLNRDWAYGWSSTTMLGDELDTGTKGTHPFSQPETQVARKHLEYFRPNAFLSIHSGDRALWLPGAYDARDMEAKQVVSPSLNTLQEISRFVKNYTHCGCQEGIPPGHHPGTSLDYVGLQMKVPYSMAWEIYENEAISGFNECLGHFNPTDEVQYQRLLGRWSAATFFFAEEVANALQYAADRSHASPASPQRQDPSSRVARAGNARKSATSGRPNMRTRVSMPSIEPIELGSMWPSFLVAELFAGSGLIVVALCLLYGRSGK